MRNSVSTVSAKINHKLLPVSKLPRYSNKSLLRQAGTSNNRYNAERQPGPNGLSDVHCEPMQAGRQAGFTAIRR